ncbi:IS6 family transposase [Halorussus amylolyticus]|uniref:IS6 family transposase n=1 Tax=Halorussus amylolyticus TaxID=1126242 RepID=UPI001053614D|nr:IS6 family transposase [Halorussus amylolyticus]
MDLEFVERERTPRPAIEVGIRLHLAGLSLSNTKREIEKLGVERSRTAIHNWVQKTDLQPTSDTIPNQIAVDETVIRVTGERCWLYAAVNPATNEFLHSQLFQALTTQLTLLFFRDLREKQQVEQATFLVDEAHHLQTALTRLGLRFQYIRHGNRNSVERVFREVKRRTSSFSNAFRNVELETAESWLQACAVWHNSCQT